MTKIATRKSDIKKLQRLVESMNRIEALRRELRELEEQTEPDKKVLQKRYPEGIALALPKGKAAIVEFNTFERQCVNMEAVKRLLKNKLPIRKIKVNRVSVSDGVIE